MQPLQNLLIKQAVRTQGKRLVKKQFNNKFITALAGIAISYGLSRIIK